MSYKLKQKSLVYCTGFCKTCLRKNKSLLKQHKIILGCFTFKHMLGLPW